MKLVKPPGTVLWHHQLIADLAVNPDSTALEIAWRSNYKPSTCASLLRRLTSKCLIEHSCGLMTERTYRLTDAGEKLFDDIANYSDALHRVERRTARPTGLRKTKIIPTPASGPTHVSTNAVTAAKKDHAHERRHATNITAGLARFASGLTRT